MTGRRPAYFFLAAAAILLLQLAQGYAQTRPSFSGSLESNGLYDPDPNSPYKGFHANNYLRTDVTIGAFSAGLQLEWYPSPMPGFDHSLQGWHLPITYVSWQNRNWSVTAGSFYEQLGNGILLRSWEDRSLGLANSLGGLRVKGTLLDGGINLTLLAGAPRRNDLCWGYAPTLVSGADLDLDLPRLFGWDLPVGFTLGDGITDRYEWTPDNDLSLLLGTTVPASVLMHSVRAGFSAGSFQLDAGYVGKGQDFTAVRHNGSSDTYELQAGRAFYADASWTVGPVSLTASWRYLDNMALKAWRDLGSASQSNTLNYLPALCQQQTYMLAGLNPYETYAEGENGFRADLYYRFARGSVLGGKYGMTLHVGGSWINALGKVLPRRDKDHLAYRDLNIELKRKWNSRLKTTLFVSIQENSPTHGNRNATEAQNVFVLEGQYAFSSNVSLRTELQYLYSQEREKDWMAALVELGIAPHWSFTVSDMYNHGSSHEHFWNVTASWSLNALKCIVGYGRNKEGMVCSGGVCRWQPEYQGLFFRIQYTL